MLHSANPARSKDRGQITRRMCVSNATGRIGKRTLKPAGLVEIIVGLEIKIKRVSYSNNATH